MCMAGLGGEPSETRTQFALLRQLRDDHQNEDCPHISLRELSMGMSGDFEMAIEEGATLVRVGSTLFGSVCVSSAAVLPRLRGRWLSYASNRRLRSLSH